ncbi:DNA-binding transcriptional LysR family regulator [Ureibacillus xyleni]|uniref:DNA-binding transcriptional LysR family regulator n=1 Tax=Ureibacillus xyleni TaxID=614648 RepID=A0A285TPH9_9BACL|nr:LysR family transcriptional regulator [Ureibacillus xyleni]SOC25064.1 DNA-binding transcriptional LysR family regulator [Ureibacillus xyleni]
MELRHLEYFLMLSKELHFTKAAEKLGISQPTLSHQIKMLEKEIGYSLFNRVGKRVELTKVGEIVQQETLNIRDSIQSMSSQITALSKVEIGELKIAVLPGEITDLVSTLCIQFNQLYPNIKVIIETTDQVEKSVLQNKADFGIDFQLNPNDLLEVTKLYDEEFYLISNEKSDTQNISFSSALDGPLILFPSIHQCRKLLNKTSCEIGKPFEPIVETSSIRSILNLVRNGVGRSIVSRTLYEFYETEDLFFQHIDKPSLNRAVYLVMKRNCFINYAAREYIKLLVSEIEKLHFHIEKEAIDSLHSVVL